MKNNSIFIKKLLTITLALTLIMTLVSCSKKEETEGIIEEVETEDVTPEPQTEIPEGTFTKRDSPFSYTYKDCQINRAKLKFDVPESWNVEVSSARYISMEPPNDDPNFPGLSFNLIFDYARIGFADYPDEMYASNFYNYFQYEIPYIKYKFGDDYYQVRYYKAADRQISDPDFVGNNEHTVTLAMRFDDDVIKSTTKDQINMDVTQLVYYINWLKIPCMLSTVVPKEYSDNAREMMEYMISSFSPVSDNYETTTTLRIGDATVTLPSEFTQREDAENVYVVMPLMQNGIAGMGFGIFDLDPNKDAEISLTTMESQYSAMIAKQLLSYGYDNYNYTLAVYQQDNVMIGGCDAEFYASRVYCEPTIPLESAVKTFIGHSSNFTILTYVIRDGDKERLVSFAYQDQQAMIALTIDDLIRETFKMNN